jgi:hypothetical protein
MSEPSQEGAPISALRTQTFRLRPPEFIEDTMALYANFVQATTTAYDLTFHFGWYATPTFEEPPETGLTEVPVRALAKVSIPLGLIRGVIDVLEKQLDAWEKVYGQPLPASPRIEQEAPESEASGS